jgi:hypothetical protein
MIERLKGGVEEQRTREREKGERGRRERGKEGTRTKKRKKEERGKEEKYLNCRGGWSEVVLPTSLG